MNILFCVQNYYPALSLGGRVTQTVALAEGLAALGHEVTVLTSSVLDLDSRPAIRGGSEMHNGVQVYYAGTWLRYRTTSFNPGAFSYCLLRLSSFDVIHVMGMYDSVGVIAMFLAVLKGIPYVLEPAGMLLPVMRSFRKKAIYHLLVGRRMVSGAARLIATSDHESEDIVKYGVARQRVFVRRHGVNLEEFNELPTRGFLRQELGLSPDTHIVLFLGRISPMKQLDILIQAFAALDISEAFLLIAGPDEGDGYKESLDHVVSETGVSDRIRFLGPLYGTEKLQALVDADQLVMSSHSESWGHAGAEAIAAGTPVIVTDKCGLATYVRDRAGLVVAADVLSISDAMRRLIVERPLYEKFKRNTIDVSRDLSWDEPVRLMEKLYKESLQR